MRVGYYVNNEYDDEELREEPPPTVLIERVQRNILVDKPRVTKFPIDFHPHTEQQPLESVENEQELFTPPDQPSDDKTVIYVIQMLDTSI